MSTVTVRIHRETRDSLREIASRAGRTMPEILDQAVEQLRRHQFLEGLSEDFAALREDSDSWQQELDERAAWDATVGDDLAES